MLLRGKQTVDRHQSGPRVGGTHSDTSRRHPAPRATYVTEKGLMRGRRRRTVAASRRRLRLASEAVIVGAVLMLAIVVVDVFAAELYALTDAASVFTSLFAFRFAVFSLLTLVSTLLFLARSRGTLSRVFGFYRTIWKRLIFRI